MLLCQRVQLSQEPEAFGAIVLLPRAFLCETKNMKTLEAKVPEILSQEVKELAEKQNASAGRRF